MNNAIPLAALLALGAAAILIRDPAEHRSPGRAPAVPADLHEPLQHAITPVASGDVEVIAGLPVRKDRRCQVELLDYVTPAGEMFSAYRCTPYSPRTPHPYAHYDNGSLAALAWSDPEAAALLGRRLAGIDRSRSYDLLVRATALTGDVSHLAWLADQAYSSVRIDGDLQVGNVQRRYELAALASRLGGDPGAPQYLRNLLVDAGLGEEQLQILDERVETLLESVRGIQRMVHGEVRFGGQNDA